MSEDLFDKIEKRAENKNDPFYIEGEIVGHMNPFLPVKIILFLALIAFVISLFYIVPAVKRQMSIPKGIVVKGANYYEDVNCDNKQTFNCYTLHDDHTFTKYMYAETTTTKTCLFKQYGSWWYYPDTKELVLTVTSYTNMSEGSYTKHWFNEYFYEHFKVVNNNKIIANEPNYTATFKQVDKYKY